MILKNTRYPMLWEPPIEPWPKWACGLLMVMLSTLGWSVLIGAFIAVVRIIR